MRRTVKPMPEKITENEIIKALERMSEEDPEGFSADILDFINRQKANDEKNENVIRLADKTIEKQSKEIEKQQEEIEKLSTEIDQRNEMMANMGVELGKAQKNADIHLDHVRFLQKELKKFQDIESTISEFWTGLEKLSMFKGKEEPTLEELLEYIEQKDEEIRRLQKDKADIIDAVEYRINQAKKSAYKELAKKLKDRVVSRCEYTDIRVFNELDNLLAELTPTALTKLDHSSLCETDTYEGDLKG
jgi:septal ring factor EnvC (AmiA/AmiB activator)